MKPQRWPQQTPSSATDSAHPLPSPQPLALELRSCSPASGEEEAVSPLSLDAMSSVLNIAVSLIALGLSVGQRNVMVPKGPLVRAKGYNITILCQVSGYQGPQEQNFLWSVYLPSYPEREIKLVSTQDPSFAYASYAARVQSRGIYIERVKEDYVLLHITDLQDQDAGEYECFTPSTDDKYYGNYSAKINLLVIPDTLEATMASQTLEKVEGDPLELICTVSKATSWHTHLSLTWYLNSEGKSAKILSLSRDFVLSPGSSYVQRFASGDVRLDKTGGTIYKMTFSKLQPSDQGKIYCEAIEWIQDPDGSWKDITKKETEMTTVNIEQLGRDFTTDIASAGSPLLIGSSLEVTCSVKAQNLPSRLFQVSWLHSGMAAAWMDPHGVPTFSNEYGIRECLGQLRVVRRSMERYSLVVSHVALEDGGTYSCEVSEMERTSSGALQVVQSKRSPEGSILITQIESSLEVSIQSNMSHIIEGQSIVFHCSASGTANPLSVSWHLARGHEQRVQIAGMERDGSLRLGSSYLARHTHGTLRAEKTGPTYFLLGLDSTLTTDGGLYRCEVTEWSQAPDGTWRILNEKHQETQLDVIALGTGLVVTLQSRTPTVHLGDTFALTCKISVNQSTSESPMSITWQVLPHGSTGDSFQPLVRIFHEGGIKWMHQRLQEKGMVTWSAPMSTLTIRRASWQDATSYRCKAEVLRRSQQKTWITAATVRSHRVTIHVTPKKSKLALSTNNKPMTISSGKANLEIECELAKVEEDSHFAVTWYIIPPSNTMQPIRILNTSSDGVVEYGTDFDSVGAKAKYYSERVSRTMYKLHVLQVDYNDQGSYYCAVEEWAWLEEDGWILLGSNESGKTTIEFKRSEKNVQLIKANHTITATENEDVAMSCGLEGPVRPGFLLSITWFHQKGSSRPRVLLKMGHNMMVEYPDEGKATRLRFHTPSPWNYSLTLQKVAEEDGGLYYCQAEEWQVGPTGIWEKEGADLSGSTHLMVHRPADNLRVNTTALTLTLPEGRDNLILACEVTSRSTPSSTFSVAWWKDSGAEKQLVFMAGRELLFQFGNTSGSNRQWDGKLRFERPSEMWYQLTILKPELSDSGIYFCEVEEWMLNHAKIAYKTSQKRSGNITVVVQHAEMTFPSRVCSSPSLVTFILIFPIILLLAMVVVATVLWLRSRCAEKEHSDLKSQKSLWATQEDSIQPINAKLQIDEDE